jgi:hypothetical protein
MLGDPTSAASSIHAFASSMFFRTTAGSGEWNSHVVPSPPILTGDASNRAFTPRARSSRGSARRRVCASSAAPRRRIQASVRFAMIVGMSQSFAML